MHLAPAYSVYTGTLHIICVGSGNRDAGTDQLSDWYKKNLHNLRFVAPKYLAEVAACNLNRLGLEVYDKSGTPHNPWSETGFKKVLTTLNNVISANQYCSCVPCVQNQLMQQHVTMNQLLYNQQQLAYGNNIVGSASQYLNQPVTQFACVSTNAPMPGLPVQSDPSFTFQTIGVPSNLQSTHEMLVNGSAIDSESNLKDEKSHDAQQIPSIHNNITNTTDVVEDLETNLISIIFQDIEDQQPKNWKDYFDEMNISVSSSCCGSIANDCESIDWTVDDLVFNENDTHMYPHMWDEEQMDIEPLLHSCSAELRESIENIEKLLARLEDV